MWRLWGALLSTMLSLAVYADNVVVEVVTAYVDVRTGPSMDFPAFHALERNEQVTLLRSHTGWYRVRTEKGIEGWVSSQDLQQMTYVDGSQVQLRTYTFEAFRTRRYEFGAFAGRLDQVNVMSVSAAWSVTENIAVEASAGQALGDFSDNQLWIVRLNHSAFPEWRLSPYLSLGAGQIRTEPNATLVQSGAGARTSDLLEAGIGVRYYLLQRFSVRAEFKRLTALTSRDEFEELNQWTLGVSMFF